MKPYLPLAVLLSAGVAAIVAVQHQHINTQPTVQTLLSVAADGQYEMTRLPASLDRMSDADEIAIGDETARQAEAYFGAHSSGSAGAEQVYLQQVGLRVAARARRKMPWKFHYIADSGFVNAFALPGGHVFVGAGLLQLMHSEDALAAVLGHEIEHVDLRHCAEMAQTEAHLRHLGPLAGLPLDLFVAGYSKEQELAADRDGTTLAVRAGYNYNGALQLFDEFAHMEAEDEPEAGKAAGPLAEAAKLSLSTASGYLASHPPSSQRSQRLREQASEDHWPTPALRPLQNQKPLGVETELDLASPP